MAIVRWKLRQYLDANNITPYALAKNTPGVTLKVAYNLSRDETEGVRFSTLAAVMEGLSRLTGEPVGFDDLLEYTPVG